MRREQTLEEISDGKLYDSNDMVKADCLNSEKPSNNVRIPAPTIAEGSIINTL